MKTIKFIMFFLAIVCLSFVAVSCNGSGDKTKADHTHHAENAGMEYTAAYVCPMHCEGSGSDSAGKCPVCGMDYVQNEEHYKDGHSHK